MDLNRIQLIGRMTQDPELRETPSGASVCSFTVVTNYSYKDKNTGEKKDIPEFHNCVAWRGLGETIAKYLKKGSKVFVEGRVQTRSWDDPNGGKKYKTEMIIENMIMLDSKGGSGGNDGGFDLPAAGPSRPEADDEISIDEVPF